MTPLSQTTNPGSPDAPKLIGGRLSLDFTNTVSGRHAGARKDYLTTYEDLVRWSVHAGALERAATRALHGAARRRPDEAAAVLRRAVELREALFRIFTSASAGQQPSAADLAMLNREWGEALRHLELAGGEPCCTVRYAAPHQALDSMLWAIARSATELLTSDDVRRVKACGDDSCAWLFCDESRNRSRRWCDMRDCGNRAKARRHYARRRASERRRRGASSRER